MFFERLRADQVIVLETLPITFETLPPTLVMAVIAATAISEAISVYSMAVAPCSFFMRRRKMDSICISKRNSFLTAPPPVRIAFLGSAGRAMKTLGQKCGP